MDEIALRSGSAFCAPVGAAFRNALGSKRELCARSCGGSEHPSTPSTLDDAVALELKERISEPLVVDAQRGPELGARERCGSAGQSSTHLLCNRRRRRLRDVVLVGVWSARLEMSSSLVAHERDADRVGRSGAAVFEGKHQATATADEIRR